MYSCHGLLPNFVPFKVRTFLEQMKTGGIALKEPERYLPHRHWSREKKEDPTKVFEE